MNMTVHGQIVARLMYLFQQSAWVIIESTLLLVAMPTKGVLA